MSFSSDGDVVDILLKLSGLQAFNAGAREASASIKEIGTASEDASAKSKASGSKMSGVAGLAQKAFMGTAVAVAAFGLESVKMATSFDNQMEMIHTQAGATQSEVSKMSEAILDMAASGQYAQGPQQLAEGLYHLESIGLRGANALNALKIAAQGAAVGGADLEDTTTALGSAWLVNIKGAGDLQNVMGILNATVGAGNMKMQDLVQSLGTGVLPAAKLAGLGITDVMGALATLTDEGWQGSSAMAQLATALHFLTDPTTKAQKALASIGLTATQLATIMRTQGLQPALATLREHLAALSPVQQEQVLGNILPAGRGRVLEVLMNQVDRYAMKIRQITKTSNQFGSDVAATHQTAAFKIHAAWSQVQADMIRVGHFLEPLLVMGAHDVALFVTALVAIAPTLGKILLVLSPLVAAFLAYRAAVIAVGVAQAAMGAAAFVTGTLLPMVAAGYSLTEMFAELNLVMLANPFVLVAVAIVAVGAALVLAYTKVKWFRDAVNAALGFIVGMFVWLKNSAATVADFLIKHWRLVIAIALGPLGVAIDAVTKHWQFFSHIATTVAHAVYTAFIWMGTQIEKLFVGLYKILSAPFTWFWTKVVHPVANWIVGAFQWVANEVLKIFQRIVGPIKSVAGFLGGAIHTGSHVLGSVGNFLGLQSGGTLTSSGAVWVGERGPELLSLPRGASVAPLRTMGTPATGALGGNLTIVVPVQIDRREVARAVGKVVSDGVARS